MTIIYLDFNSIKKDRTPEELKNLMMDIMGIIKQDTKTQTYIMINTDETTFDSSMSEPLTELLDRDNIHFGNWDDRPETFNKIDSERHNTLYVSNSVEGWNTQGNKGRGMVIFVSCANGREYTGELLQLCGLSYPEQKAYGEWLKKSKTVSKEPLSEWIAANSQTAYLRGDTSTPSTYVLLEFESLAKDSADNNFALTKDVKTLHAKGGVYIIVNAQDLSKEGDIIERLNGLFGEDYRAHIDLITVGENLPEEIEAIRDAEPNKFLAVSSNVDEWRKIKGICVSSVNERRLYTSDLIQLAGLSPDERENYYIWYKKPLINQNFVAGEHDQSLAQWKRDAEWKARMEPKKNTSWQAFTRALHVGDSDTQTHHTPLASSISALRYFTLQGIPTGHSNSDRKQAVTEDQLATGHSGTATHSGEQVPAGGHVRPQRG